MYVDVSKPAAGASTQWIAESGVLDLFLLVGFHCVSCFLLVTPSCKLAAPFTDEACTTNDMCCMRGADELRHLLLRSQSVCGVMKVGPRPADVSAQYSAVTGTTAMPQLFSLG